MPARFGAEWNGFSEAGIGCSPAGTWYQKWDVTTPPLPDLVG